MNNKTHLKPLFWGLFSVGGTIAALALASIILILCVFLPFLIAGTPLSFYSGLHSLVANKFVFLVLASIIFVILWHGVHRFYYLLHDMHIHVSNGIRNIFYLLTIAVFIATLIVGWFG